VLSIAGNYKPDVTPFPAASSKWQVFRGGGNMDVSKADFEKLP
jgi:hypothetical protein